MSFGTLAERSEEKNHSQDGLKSRKCSVAPENTPPRRPRKARRAAKSTQKQAKSIKIDAKLIPKLSKVVSKCRYVDFRKTIVLLRKT